MSNTIRSYRGLEIYPLVYPHQPRGLDGARHYDAGFDAAVRICRRGTDDTMTSSRVFRVPSRSPFGAAGDALRWHLIGHLQRNKARRAVQLFYPEPAAAGQADPPAAPPR